MYTCKYVMRGCMLMYHMYPCMYVCMYNIYINRVQRIRKCYDYKCVFCHTATIGEHSALIVPREHSAFIINQLFHLVISFNRCYN